MGGEIRRHPGCGGIAPGPAPLVLGDQPLARVYCEAVQAT
jgi:hypothetical protein